MSRKNRVPLDDRVAKAAERALAARHFVSAIDILVDYYHGVQIGLADIAGSLSATYAIPIVYVPLLMITHVVAFYLLTRSDARAIGRSAVLQPGR